MNQKTHPFRLGDVVRDKITRISGTAVSRMIHITGCDVFAIEPTEGAELGKLPEPVHLTADRLELVKSQPHLHVDETMHCSRFKLGDRLRDPYTKFEGIATVWMIPLFGSQRVSLEPPYDTKQNKMPDGYLFDEHRLELVKADPVKMPATPVVDGPGREMFRRASSRLSSLR